MTAAQLADEVLTPAERDALGALLPAFDFARRASPKQRRFLESRHIRRMLRSGNQVGKTETAAHEAWSLAVGCHPCKKVAPAPTLGIIVSPDWQSYRDVVAAAMWRTAPHALLAASNAYTKERGWKHKTIQLKNGSQIIFRVAGQQTTAVAGLTADWLWIDEPLPPTIWGEAMARVSVKRGPAFMTLTPIGMPMAWLREHIEGDEAKGIEPREDWEQHRIRLTVEDCPHRTQESIDIQLAGCSTWELPQRRDGEWEGITSGRKLDGFQEDNTGEPAEGVAYLVRLSLDHGEGAGKEFVLLGYIDRKAKRLYVVEEYVSESVTTPDQDMDGIIDALRRRGLSVGNIDAAVGDINSAGKQAAGRKVNELFGALLKRTLERPDKRPGSVDYGVRLLNYGFREQRLIVSPKCVKLIRCLKNWKGDNDTLKDGIDSLRYLAVPVLESFMKPADLARLRVY